MTLSSSGGVCRALHRKEYRMPPKRAEKRQEARAFSFRMPGELYDDLTAVARAQGVDVSALLNWILAKYRPALIQQRAEHEKAMMEAIAAREWEREEPAVALRTLREL